MGWRLWDRWRVRYLAISPANRTDMASNAAVRAALEAALGDARAPLSVVEPAERARELLSPSQSRLKPAPRGGALGGGGAADGSDGAAAAVTSAASSAALLRAHEDSLAALHRRAAASRATLARDVCCVGAPLNRALGDSADAKLRTREAQMYAGQAVLHHPGVR